jgi:aminoglycoside phosphotransferase (APT) family kinase protein
VSPTLASDDQLPQRIAALLRLHDAEAAEFGVTELKPLFGGNARRAYAFSAERRLAQTMTVTPCVMLSHASGRHVASDILAEYRVLRGLAGKGVRAPQALALDETGASLGAPSIVMQRIEGSADAVAFLNRKNGVRSRELTVDLAVAAAELHRVDPGFMDSTGRIGECTPEAYVRLEIERWETSFRVNRLEPLPVIVALFGWLKTHIPKPAKLAIVHGDLRPGNFLYQGVRISGILDWEMVHIGDPVEDIAWIYRPMWSPERFVPLREFVAQYSRAAGFAVPWASIEFYRIFSEIKFATISLCAANTFISGASANLRHADRAAKVTACVSRCLDWLESDADWCPGV